MLDGGTEEHRKRIQPKDLWRQLKDPVTALVGMQGFLITTSPEMSDNMPVETLSPDTLRPDVCGLSGSSQSRPALIPVVQRIKLTPCL